MRDQFAPVIEGFDCDGITSPWSFRCEPFYEDGGNGGIMLDGTTVQDVLAVKNRFSWALGVLTMARYNALVSALDSGSEPDTVSAIVFDPATDTRYTTTFHVTPPVFRFVIAIDGAMVAVADSALVLEETGYERITFPIMGNGYTLYDDGTLELDPPPEGSIEPEVDRWRRILDDPNTPIHDVDRIVLKPGVPSLPPSVLDQFPNLKEIVIPPDVEIDPDAFDNCPNLTVIKILSFPRKSDYAVGDALDYAGLSVVKISGGTERDITPDCVLIPADGYTTTETGDIMVDVRYHDKSLCTFWVTVAEAAVIASGDWWTLTSDGVLDIYCDGDMPDDYRTPWYDYRTQITSVSISDSVTSIGDSAFYICTSLTSVEIPSGVTSIGNGAFALCTGLTSVTIPDGVTSIGDSAFYGCTSLTSITIPDGVTNIGNSTFKDCTSLTSVTIPDGVTSIGYNMFLNCTSLTSVEIPSGVTSIGNGAFSSCTGLTSVTIPDGVTSIGNGAFNWCTGLTSVTIPDSVTSIKQSAFYHCISLASVTIPDGVTSIENYVFIDCSRLTSVTIPDSVTSIGDSAFGYCWRLTDVYYGGTESQWDAITIGNNNTLTSATIHYNSSPT